MMLADFFASYPLALTLFTFVTGLVIGSFLNVVIYRYPLMMQLDWRKQCHEFLELQEPVPDKPHFNVFNLAAPGSHCPQCNHAISVAENIPVISYLIQGGKCRHCQSHIPVRYPAIELLTAFLSTLVVALYGFEWLALALLLFTWILVVLTVIDLDHQLLPDDITLPLLWLGLIVNSMGWLTNLESAVFGAIGGYLTLWCVYWGFKLLTGKEGMGYGDFKLLAALGAWLGWQALPQIILLSSFVGALVGLGLILFRGRDRNIPIPFGPYLASAGFLSLLWGEELTTLFLSLVA
jgi:leader peptidase (prepilin peptidase) / N-methyltransferase